MFSAVLGVAPFAGGAGALFLFEERPAGPHRLLRSATVEEFVTLTIVLLVVSGSMLMVYGLVAACFDYGSGLIRPVPGSRLDTGDPRAPALNPAD